jgi:hypothetical protein
MKLKVLPLDLWVEALETPGWRDLILKDLEHYTEVPPRINRNGRYYDRETNFCWFEVEGRAWEGDSAGFMYDLESLDYCEHALNKECVEAIKTLLKYGVKGGNLQAMLGKEQQRQALRNIGMSARRFKTGSANA